MSPLLQQYVLLTPGKELELQFSISSESHQATKGMEFPHVTAVMCHIMWLCPGVRRAHNLLV